MEAYYFSFAKFTHNNSIISTNNNLIHSITHLIYAIPIYLPETIISCTRIWDPRLLESE